MKLPNTERTVIDFITLDDASFFVELVNSPEWLRFVGDRKVANEHDAREFLRQGLLQFQSENGFGYYIAKLQNSHIPIGICGFVKKPELENPDFGFALLPAFYGQGFAYEFSSAVLSYGVQKFGFRVLDAVTTPDNIRSIRLLEKLQFEYLGTVKCGDEDDLKLFRWEGKI